MLALSLDQLLSTFVTEALQNSMRTRFPELFEKKDGELLTPAEINGEVNRFMGLAIFSSVGRLQRKLDEDARQILACMIICLDDADDKYFEKRYSTHMNLLNNGGLTLVSEILFPFGMQLMTAVRESFTMQHMDNNPKHAFKIAKKALLENKRLSNYFRAICQRHSELKGKKFEKAVSAVYKMVLPKVIHSRFAVVFCRWKEKHVQSKDKHALRPVLKVGVSNKAKKDSTAKTPKKKKIKRNAVTPTLSKSQCTLNRKRRTEILVEKRQRKKREHNSQKI